MTRTVGKGGLLVMTWLAVSAHVLSDFAEMREARKES